VAAALLALTASLPCLHGNQRCTVTQWLPVCSQQNILAQPAGTALGDPIEVGAALAVWAAPPPASRQLHAGPAQPLELAAAKSVLGHAEPAAGAAGMLRALWRLAAAAPSGTLHLAAVNPYIAASLEDARGTAPCRDGTAAVPPVWMPRAPGSAASPSGGGGGGGQAAGVSGFAFQGTNAHVVLTRCAKKLVEAVACWGASCVRSSALTAEFGREALLCKKLGCSRGSVSSAAPCHTKLSSMQRTAV
jgi:hypothetical protein